MTVLGLRAASPGRRTRSLGRTWWRWTGCVGLRAPLHAAQPTRLWTNVAVDREGGSAMVDSPAQLQGARGKICLRPAYDST